MKLSMDQPVSESRPIVECRNLRKAFGANEVLRGISFEIPSGVVLSVIGASGSGKSTFLRCLNFLEQPTSGEVFLDGEPMGIRLGKDGRFTRDSPANIARMRAQIGMVFQQFNLWPHMTALENVTEALRQVKGMTIRRRIVRSRIPSETPASICPRGTDWMPARIVSDRKPLYAKPNPSTEATNGVRLNCVESRRESRIGRT
jgi:ABC-type transporter Mla maintaining outer membrane lipid asymmetry ATPase subunit MlaF